MRDARAARRPGSGAALAAADTHDRADPAALRYSSSRTHNRRFAVQIRNLHADHSSQLASSASRQGGCIFGKARGSRPCAPPKEAAVPRGSLVASELRTRGRLAAHARSDGPLRFVHLRALSDGVLGLRVQRVV